MEKILEVNGLSVTSGTSLAQKVLIDSVSFYLGRGEVLGITGESGSGKSLTSLCLMGLQDSLPGIIASGCVRINGKEIMGMPEAELSAVRGKSVSIVFQQPDSVLNPVRRCGKQLVEAITVHQKNLTKTEVNKLAASLLVKTGLTETDRIFNSYPFQLSGGQLQRIAVAMALANKPDIIIADEVTSSLDTETAAQIIGLLLAARDEGASVIIVSHDLPMLQKICPRILFVQDGKITDEYDEGRQLSEMSEYAARLMKPQSPELRKLTETGESMLKVTGLSRTYSHGLQGLFGRGTKITALSGVSFELRKGEMLGVMGVSGSGKSTLAKIICGLEEASDGDVIFQDCAIRMRDFETNRSLRRRIQYVFQDPYTVFDPLQTFGDAMHEVIKAHRMDNAADRINRVLAHVSLTPELLGRYVHQVSGGQRQRLALARVMLLEPDLLVFDESLSALDVTNRYSIAENIIKIQKSTRFSGIFISHDRDLVRAMCHNVLVMENGAPVIYGNVDDILPSQVQNRQEQNLRI